MKQFLEELFSAETDSLDYKKIVLNFLIGIILPVALIIGGCFIPSSSPFRSLVFIPTIIVGCMAFLFFCRLINVGDNRDENAVKNNKHKYKYTPVKVSVQDFILLLDIANSPETIYTKSSLGKNHIFEISFDIGKNGLKRFYDKAFILDGKELKDSDQCIQTLEKLKIINNGYIDVYETFDHNKPEIILKIIEKIKASEGNTTT